LVSFEKYLSIIRTPGFNKNRDWINRINNVAAILVEPFQSSAGYYIPPVGYLQELRRIADKFGMLLIVDAGLGSNF